MVNTQIALGGAPQTQVGKSPASADGGATEQAFQALLSTALQSELPQAAETLPRDTQQTEAEAQPTQPGGPVEKAEKPVSKDETSEQEVEPAAELALVAMPIQVEPAPETNQDAVLELSVPVTVVRETTQPTPTVPVQAEAEIVPEAEEPVPTQQVQEEIPILQAELVVEEPVETVQPVIIQPQATQPQEEAQARFDSMVAQASRQLQPQTEQAKSQPEPAVPTQQTESPQPPKPQQEETKLPRMEQASTPTQRRVREEESQPVPQMVTETQAEPEPDATPISGAERSQLFPTPAQQIQDQVTENLENQRMEFRMQLQPRELGRVDVRMVLEGGKLAVQIIAATPKAAEALRTQTDGLMASMKMANIQLESVQVVQESQGQEEHLYGGFNMMGGSGSSGEQPGGDGTGAHTAQAQAETAPEGSTTTFPESLLDTAV